MVKKYLYLLILLVAGYTVSGFTQPFFPGNNLHQTTQKSWHVRSITELPFIATVNNRQDGQQVLKSFKNLPINASDNTVLKLQKYVVLEESTGTWCQWCPGGIYYGDSLSRSYENVYVISVHGSDMMENTEHMNGTGLTAYPSANIDRNYTGKGISEWFSSVNEALQSVPVASITVVNTFDTVTRELSVTVSATFSQNVSGDYRLGAVIVEDGVTGPQPQYNQSNSYSGGTYGPMGGFETLPFFIPANMIAYNCVSRQLLGGYAGEPESLPELISAGETHDYTFSYILPEDRDEDLVYVIAWLIKPDGKIDNAIKSPYLNGNDNAKPVFLSNPITEAYVNSNYSYGIFVHDPDNQGLTIVDTQLPEWLSLSSTISVGHIHDKAILSGIPDNPGDYEVILTVSDGENISIQNFIITVEEEMSGSWDLIGEAGFTTGQSQNYDLAVADDGTLYLITNENDYLEVYKKEEGSNWVSIGLHQLKGWFGQIEIASDGSLYIAYSYDFNDVYVKRYNGITWEQIGSSPTSGVQLGLVLDSEDHPIIVLQDFNNNSKGLAYIYDGINWSVLGGTAYSTVGLAGVWNVLRIDENDIVYVLWGAFDYSGTPAYVSKYDGSNWVIVGDGPVGEANVYYYPTFDIDDNGYVYVAYPAGSATKSLETFKFTGTSWINTGSNLVGGATEHCKMRADVNGNIILAFSDISYNGNISALNYDGNDWTFIGPRGFTGTGGNYPVLDVMGETPYVGYSDLLQDGKATVRAYLKQQIAVIHINPSEIVFDTTVVNYTSEAALFIVNQGNAVLEVTNLNSSNNVFTANVNQLTIEPGDTATVAITFAPTLEQWYTGTIAVQSNDPVSGYLEIPVSGYGIIENAVNELSEPNIIWPNPASEMIYVHYPTAISKIQMINYSGQAMYEESVDGFSTEISVKGFRPGVYFIKIFTIERVITEKVVIK